MPDLPDNPTQGVSLYVALSRAKSRLLLVVPRSSRAANFYIDERKLSNGFVPPT